MGALMKLKVESFAIGSYGCNCTVIYDEISRQALAVDPGNDAKTFLQWISDRDLKVTHLLHTHAHFDHIGGSKIVREQTGAKVCLHKGDKLLYQALPVQSMMFGQAPMTAGPVDHFLQDEEEFNIQQPLSVENAGKPFGLKTLYTPGHTEGSCCFYSDQLDQPLLLAGDTLFQGSVGRTDLPGGDFNQLKKSIRDRLYNLPEETLVITGHGPSTTIGAEGKHNPFVNF